MTVRAPAASAAILLLLASIGAVLVWLSSPTVLRLMERLPEAATDFEGGRYPSFVGTRRLAQAVELGGRSLEALTPPFPSKLTFEVEIPDAAFLELSPALVMRQQVTRARVEYVVSVEADGATDEVFSRLLDQREANLWHDERIDLSPWRGRRVRLTLETRADPPRDDILWADRIQAVWGDPLLADRFWERRRRAWAPEVSRWNDWLRSEAASVGVGVEERITLSRFGLNLLLAGVLSISMAATFRMSSFTGDQGSELMRVLPLVTLVMTIVISIVHLSVPLSLGLIGALSIIRFRTPIRSGAELLALLVAIALGLTLGAGERLLAVSAMIVVSLLVFVLSFGGEPDGRRRLQLTLTASGKEPDTIPSLDELVAVLREVSPNAVVQELYVEGGRVRFRALVTVEGAEETSKLGASLWRRLPRFDVSYRQVDGRTE